MTKSYMKSLMTIAAIVLFSGTAAYGQWKFEAVEDDFADHEIQYGYVEQGISQIGVKCQGGAYELVYVMSDRTVDAFTLAAIDVTGGTKLMFRTDKNRPETLTAKLDLLVDGRLRAIGKLSSENVRSIHEMKQTLAVQLSLEGTASNQMKFNAKGSTAVIKQVAAGCDVEPRKLTRGETAKLSLILASILFPPLPLSID